MRAYGGQSWWTNIISHTWKSCSIESPRWAYDWYTSRQHKELEQLTWREWTKSHTSNADDVSRLNATTHATQQGESLNYTSIVQIYDARHRLPPGTILIITISPAYTPSDSSSPSPCSPVKALPYRVSNPPITSCYLTTIMLAIGCREGSKIFITGHVATLPLNIKQVSVSRAPLKCKQLFWNR